MAKVICLLLITTGAGMADNTIRMQVSAKSKTLDAKVKTAVETQERWLEASVTAFHLEKASSVQLEWVLFGDNLETKEFVKHGKGSQTIDLAQGKNVNIVTKPVMFTYAPRHSVPVGTGRRAKVKVIEASGIRFHGWGIRAFVDGDLAGEAYSSSGVKKLIDMEVVSKSRDVK